MNKLERYDTAKPYCIAWRDYKKARDKKMLHLGGPVLSSKHETKKNIFSGNKDTSLLQLGTNYGPKSFITTALVSSFSK